MFTVIKSSLTDPFQKYFRLVAAIWDSVDKMELDSDPFTRGYYFWTGDNYNNDNNNDNDNNLSLIHI